MVVEEKSVSTSKVTPRSLVTQGHALVLLLHFGMQNFFSPKARTHVHIVQFEKRWLWSFDFMLYQFVDYFGLWIKLKHYFFGEHYWEKNKTKPRSKIRNPSIQSHILIWIIIQLQIFFFGNFNQNNFVSPTELKKI